MEPKPTPVPAAVQQDDRIDTNSTSVIHPAATGVQPGDAPGQPLRAPSASGERAIEDERRQEPRRPVRGYPIEVDLGHIESGLLLDVSSLGMSVERVQRLASGARVNVKFQLPGSDVVIAPSYEVIWIKDGKAGLRFLDIAEEHKQYLNKWLQAHRRGPAAKAADASNSKQPDMSSAQLSPELASLAVKLAEIDPEHALRMVTEQASLLTGADGAALLRYENGRILCCASSGTAPATGLQSDNASGLSGECIRTAKAVNCPDAELDLRVHPAVARDLNVRSILVVPICWENVVIGALEILSRSSHAFHDSHRSTLEQLAGLTAPLLTAKAKVRPQAQSGARFGAIDNPPQAPATQPTSANLRPGQEDYASVFRRVPLVQQAPAVPAESLRTSLLGPEPKQPEAISANAPVPSFGANAAAEPEEAGGTKLYLVVLCIVLVAAGMWAAVSAFLSSRQSIRSLSAPEATAPASVTAAPAPQNAAPDSQPTSASQGVQPASPRTAAAEAAEPSPTNTAPPPQSTKSSRSPAAPATPKRTLADVANRVSQASPSPPTTAVRHVASVPTTPESERNAHEVTPPVIALGSTANPLPTLPQPAPQRRPATQEAISVPTSPGPGSQEQPLNVPAESMRQRVISHPEPVYPEFARRARIQGAVVLGTVIGADGSVKTIRVLSGDPALAASAVEALRQWRYRPYLRDGTPVEVRTEVTFQFTLPKN